MAALRSRCGQWTLYFYPVVSSFFFLYIFFGCLSYFCTWCGLSANLGCKSETCCTRLAENTGRKNRQNSPSSHNRTTLLGCIFATKARIDNRKKLVKQQYLPHMSLQSCELGPLAAEIGSGVWSSQANSNGFRVLAALLHGTRVVGVSQPFGVEQRAPPIFGRAAITLGIGPHSSCFVFLSVL